MSQYTVEVQSSMLEAVKNGNLREVSRLIDSHSSWYCDSPLLLCTAIKLKHVHVAKFILEKDATANWVSSKSDIPVHLAVQIGSLELVEMLTESESGRFYIELQNSKSQTPLHIATQRGDESMVKLLLDRGAYRFPKDNVGIEPLFIACMKGFLNIVKLLFSSEITNQSLELALFLASSQGHEEIFSLLVSSANSNATAEHPPRNLGELMHFTETCPSPLFWACNKSHPGLVKLLLEVTESAEVNRHRPIDSYTPLHLAIERGYERVVELLLENGANPNLEADGNVTGLLLAAMKKHLFIVELLLSELSMPLLASKCELTKVAQILLEQGTCPNINDDDTNDLLHVAVKKGYRKTVETLLTYGTCPYEKNNSNLLHLAVSNGHKEVVKLLLNSGCDVSAKDASGKAPISYVLDFGKSKRTDCSEIVQLLLDYGADIKGTSQLFLTAINNMCSEICMVFIKNGVDANLKYTIRGEEALHAAARQGLQEIVCALIESGANVNSCDKECVTPLHLATAFGHLEIIRILLKHGANVNSGRIDGTTPLHIAAKRGTLEIVRVLVEAGADVNACDEENSTPLHCVLHHKKLEIIMTFLEKKANVNSCEKDGTTPLHIATRMGDLKIVTALIKAGANVNSVNHKNYTPLHFAVDSDKIVEKLLKCGAYINAQTISKETILHFAVKDNMKKFRLCYTIEILFNNDFDINLEDSSGFTVLDLITPNKQNATSLEKLSHDWCLRHLMEFVIKLKVAGLYVSEKIFRTYHRLDVNDWKLDSFQQGCEDEIKRLKLQMINDHLTLFDVLTRKQNPTYARNDTVMQSLASFNHEKFVIYGKRIENYIKSSKSRLDLMSTCQKSLATLLKVRNMFSEEKYPVPPAEILEEVVMYLNDQDLKSLIFCGENVKSQLNKLSLNPV